MFTYNNYILRKEVIITNFYLKKYVGKYRVKAVVNEYTNDFCRDKNGNLNNPNDIYIECFNNIQISHFGGNVLEVYIPSLKRGRRILEEINEGENFDLILNIVESDEEIIFKIKDKDLDKIIDYLKPRTLGARISPFSPKNLPKKKVVLTNSQIEDYKKITSLIPKDDKLAISQLNNKFFIEILCKNRKKNIEINKAEMKKERVKMCDYFALKGMFEKYLTFLEKEIKERW